MSRDDVIERRWTWKREDNSKIRRLCSLVFVLSRHVYPSACVVITNEMFWSLRASNVASRWLSHSHCYQNDRTSFRCCNIKSSRLKRSWKFERTLFYLLVLIWLEKSARLSDSLSPTSDWLPVALYYLASWQAGQQVSITIHLDRYNPCSTDYQTPHVCTFLTFSSVVRKPDRDLSLDEDFNLEGFAANRSCSSSC